jgi:hypothetical protein
VSATWLALACGGGTGLLAGEWLVGIFLVWLGSLVAMAGPLLLLFGAFHFLKWLTHVPPQQRAVTVLPEPRPTPRPTPPRRPPASTPRVPSPPRYARRVEQLSAVTPTHAALEALWLDAADTEQREVAGLSHTSMLLTAAGAPVTLVLGVQSAATARLESARACLAVAAKYGRGAMARAVRPELLGAPPPKSGVAAALVEELLSSGCLRADFRADVAEAGLSACELPEARSVLEGMAAQGRSYALLAWSILRWLAQSDAAATRQALREAAPGLELAVRPVASTVRSRDLLKRADSVQLLRSGQLGDVTWSALWDARLAATLAKVRQTVAALAVKPVA